MSRDVVLLVPTFWLQGLLTFIRLHKSRQPFPRRFKVLKSVGNCSFRAVLHRRDKIHVHGSLANKLIVTILIPKQGLELWLLFEFLHTRSSPARPKWCQFVDLGMYTSAVPLPNQLWRYKWIQM